MAKSHSQIQEIEAASGQDIEDADADLEAAWAALDPDPKETYTGGGYVTATDIAEKFGECETSARKRARKAVKAGTMVETNIINPNPGGHKMVMVWVPKKIYNEWKQDNADD